MTTDTIQYTSTIGGNKFDYKTDGTSSCVTYALPTNCHGCSRKCVPIIVTEVFCERRGYCSMACYKRSNKH